MSWIPAPHKVLARLLRIEEKGDSRLLDASEVFWLFCLHSISPEGFPIEMAQLKESYLVLKGEFTPPEIHTIMLQGFDNPEIAAQAVIDKLDMLTEKSRVIYVPDAIDQDSIGLYIYAHLEASRLTRMLKFKSYTEKTREMLDDALNAYVRCTNSFDGYVNAPWSDEYSVSLEAVGSFLYTTKFHICKSDGTYEDAMIALAHAIALGQSAFLLYSICKTRPYRELLSLSEISDFRYSTPWMSNLEAQTVVNCFEGLQFRGEVKNPKTLADICDLLAYVSSYSWPVEEGACEVKGKDGELWNLDDYWKHASGWVDAQLNQSEFIEIINKREEQAAEQRLKQYFFGEELWNVLPERAKRSLISADRDWFSGISIRTEAILNDLVIATEEILFIGLWKRLEERVKSNRGKTPDQKEFLIFKEKLTAKRGPSHLRILVDVCKRSITEEYLIFNGVVSEERIWFSKKLPGRVHELHNQRNRAEHQSGVNWTRSELEGYYNEFMGIGKRGILPRLCKILFSRD